MPVKRPASRAVSAEDPLGVAEQRIEWVLAQSQTSPWLRQSLEAARYRDPVELMNDLEMLQHLLSAWVRARLDGRAL